MKHLLNAACVALLAASPCLGSGPPSDGGGPVTSQRDRDARAAFAFAASFARQRAEPVKHGDSHSLPDDPAVRVWLSNGPTAYEGQPENLHHLPVFVAPAPPAPPAFVLPAEPLPFAPVMQRGVSFGGARCVTVGGRTS
jgi:hypothetical protein